MKGSFDIKRDDLFGYPNHVLILEEDFWTIMYFVEHILICFEDGNYYKYLCVWICYEK
jgi:hypothetical protein